ncbi:MAG: hypothetical protein K9K67_04260 [Bacteriovoracaceae bacterium]|nr:hypothetical protein [Bacteriovoracaceae bacterium]
MKKTVLTLMIISSLSGFAADRTKDKKSATIAKEALKYIHENAPDAKVAKKVHEALLKMCTKKPPMGCWFRGGSSITFQQLDKDGQEEGKIYDLKKWVRDNI